LALAEGIIAGEEVVSIAVELRRERALPEFYQQAIDADGILIVSSDRVSKEALVEAKFLVRNLLTESPKLRQALADAGLKVAVMAPSEFTTDVPEHSHLEPKKFWDRRARGLGGTVEVPVVSCGEENLLEFSGDPYRGENILVHEFSHAIHLVGMSQVDPTYDSRLRKTFAAARQKGLWEGTYGATNHEEYFAEGTQSWFGCNAPPGKVHGDIRTRAALEEYDPGLAKLLREVYGENSWVYSLPSERADRAGKTVRLDNKQRRFAWPETLEQVNIEAVIE
jgi:hypothetical protein